MSNRRPYRRASRAARRTVHVAALLVALLFSFPRASSAQIVSLSSFNPAEANFLCSIALDPETESLWIYECSADEILRYSKTGALLGSIELPGESSNNLDLAIAPEELTLRGTTVPRGALLITNGSIGSAEIYAVDPATGITIDTLFTEFGNNNVQGGDYDPQHDTFYLVNASVVVEIDPATGAVLGSFAVPDEFDVVGGALSVAPTSGNLFLVSANTVGIAELTREGDLLAIHSAPGITQANGIALDCARGEAWVAATGGLVSLLGQVPCDGPPEEPFAVSDGGVCTAGDIDFSWEAVGGATAYRLDLASAPQPDRILESVMPGNVTAFAFDSASLDENRRYYARVLASTDGGATYQAESDFTDGIRVDRTAPHVEPPVAVVQPANSRIRFRLFAEDAGAPITNRLQIATNPEFSSSIVDQNLGLSTLYNYDGAPGQTVYARYLAEDCAGNQSVFSGAVEITIPQLPDLVVQTVETPMSGFSGQQIEVRWTVSNTGAEGTDAAKWTDVVFVDNQPVLDVGEATLVGEVQNLTYLGSGESYTNTRSLALPRGIQGTYYLFVVTDEGRRQNESDNTNNTTASASFPVTRSPFADLQVIEIIASDNVFSGDSLDVMWTVENQGTGPTEASGWFDSVFLSEDDEFDFNFTNSAVIIRINEPFLAAAEHVGPLEPGEQYTVSLRVKLPDEQFGDRHLFVYTDVDGGKKVPEAGDVYEFDQELDNWLGEPLGITLTPPPDLVVTAVEPPAAASSGETIDLMWTVENQGPGATRTGAWSDVVYYSPTPEFDPGPAFPLGSFAHTGILQNDESYTASGLVELPDGVDGDGYFFVRTDWTGAVFEHTFGENNLSVSAEPAEITRSLYPDVEIPSAGVAPANVTAGQYVALRYETRNSGQAQAGPWTDSLFVSTESIWDRSTARPVAGLRHTATLAAGDASKKAFTVTIPTDLDGTYYFYIQADGAERIFEYPDSQNNVARSGEVVVSAYPPVDLVSSILDAPALAVAGEQIQITVRIDNAGTGRTLSGLWDDAIFLSTDPALEPDQDVLLLEVEHEGVLAAGAGYTLQRNIVIPNGLEGDYYLIVFPDDCKVSVEPGCREVPEVDTENNAAFELIEIQPAVPSDLRVTTVDVPVNMQASQPANIEWTVENSGAGITAGDGWYDAVYLSRDPSPDRADILLGVRERTGALAAATNYTGSLEVQVPAFVSGVYYLIVQADHRNEVYEHLTENNNAARRATSITLRPATDLIVTNVTAPAQAAPGEDVVISWTLQNTGDHTATGIIREGVFVSEDALWDPSDPLLGVVERTIDLGPGESLQMQGKADFGRTYAISQSGEITSVLPGIPPGDYYAIVRTDIGGHIRETDTSNNATASGATIQADIPTLVIGETEKNLISTGDSRYYRVDVPTAGEDIVIQLEKTTGGPGSAALYLRKEAAPTISTFDRSAAVPFESDQTIVLTEAAAGTYYLLIRADDLPQNFEFSISARILDYSVTSVFPQYGGNVGTVTVRLDGSKFKEGAQVFLQDADGARLQAFETFVQSSTTAVARFNLRGEMTGLRDVVIIAEGGGEAVLADAFDVVPGAGGAQMYVETSFPQAVRSCGVVEVEVTVGNRGTVNANDIAMVFGASGYVLGTGPVLRCTQEKDIAFFDDAPWPFSGPQPTRLEAPRHFDDGGVTIMPMWFYEIPPGGETTFTIYVQHFVPAGTVSHIAQLIPLPESDFTRSGAFADVESAVGYQLLRNAVQTVANGVAGASGGAGKNAFQNDVDDSINDGLLDLVTSPFPGPGTVVGFVGGFVAGAAIVYLSPAIAVTTGAVITYGLAVGALGAFAGGIYDVFNTANSAASNFGDALECQSGGFFGGGANKRGIPPAAPGIIQGGASASRCSDGVTDVKASFDPNDIIGPGGFGDANWVRATRTLAYAIRFENDPMQASAPAQVVNIRHPLDATVDERTFRLGSFGFARMSFDPPENVSFYRNRLDLTDSLGVFVDVTAGIDVTAREAFWIFQTIDPKTGTQPFNDPYAGFLPVNDSTGVGEGFASYRVRAVEGAATGDRILAQADIIFDNNAPIETPEIFNTVDADAPLSMANPQQTRRDSTSVELTWSGSDVGSGLGSFALYISVDGGDFEVHEASVADSTYLFVGESGRSYRFFTTAKDNVGNTEPLKGDGTVIAISNESVADADVPETFVLHQSYPNPFNPVATIPFDLPERADVEITVFDVIGRRVLQVQSETMAPGRHQQRVDLSGYASGVYFYELRVLGTDGTLFRDVKNFVLVK